MTGLFPLILIVLSLGTLVALVVRRLPALTLLDVDNLPEVKESKKKDEYIRKQIQKRLERGGNFSRFNFYRFTQQLRRIQLQFRQYVGKVERGVISQRAYLKKNKTPEALASQEQQVKTLLKDAHTALDHHHLEEAENKFIAAIRVDARNAEAYKGLTDVYMKKQQWDEAMQTGRFVLQIDPDNDQIYMKLGEIAEEQGKVDEAIKFYEQAVIMNDNFPQRFMRLGELLFGVKQYQTALEAVLQAVELEPENPKYLDKLVETAILVGDKKIAEQGYQQLRMVNPENQKLELLRQQILELT